MGERDERERDGAPEMDGLDQLDAAKEWEPGEDGAPKTLYLTYGIELARAIEETTGESVVTFRDAANAERLAERIEQTIGRRHENVYLCIIRNRDGLVTPGENAACLALSDALKSHGINCFSCMDRSGYRKTEEETEELEATEALRITTADIDAAFSGAPAAGADGSDADAPAPVKASEEPKLPASLEAIFKLLDEEAGSSQRNKSGLEELPFTPKSHADDPDWILWQYGNDSIENPERHLWRHVSRISKGRNESIGTGFGSLDALINGGLRPGGLYIIGAMDKMGKTTLALQIADHIAETYRREVLYIAIEMSRDELIDKTLSRYTFLDARDKGKPEKAKTANDLSKLESYEAFTEADTAIIVDAYRKFCERPGVVHVIEGNMDMTADEIYDAVRLRELDNPKAPAPVVIVDYLQRLTPSRKSGTDKQQVDESTGKLKQIALELQAPVIAISSFSREYYNKPVEGMSFKESGNIEYSADALIAMQYDGMDYTGDEKGKPGDGDRMQRVRELQQANEKRKEEGKALKIQVKVLRNRAGTAGETTLDFTPKFNIFEEEGARRRETKDAAPEKPKLKHYGEGSFDVSEDSPSDADAG